MDIVKIQFASWDKVYHFLRNDIDLKLKDLVVVRTNLGLELGEVVGFLGKNDENSESKNVDGESSVEEVNENDRELKPVLRKATEEDLSDVPDQEEKDSALDYCKQMKEKYNLPMKFIDVHFSYEGSRITFAFIADGRVDFRELVKDLTRHFGKTIRLQQIGIRDEAKITGDVGHCGKTLCCKGHLTQLVSITSEMAELQQCSHRGSDRISGICGRLMCCLAYEQNGYEDLLKSMPEVGKRVSVDGKRGEVIGHNILKQSVNVKFFGEKGESDVIMEVDLNRHKK